MIFFPFPFLHAAIKRARRARRRPPHPAQRSHLDGIQVYVHVFELLEQEQARGHALPPRDGIAFTGRRPDELRGHRGLGGGADRIEGECNTRSRVLVAARVLSVLLTGQAAGTRVAPGASAGRSHMQGERSLQSLDHPSSRASRISSLPPPLLPLWMLKQSSMPFV